MSKTEAHLFGDNPAGAAKIMEVTVDGKKYQVTKRYFKIMSVDGVSESDNIDGEFTPCKEIK